MSDDNGIFPADDIHQQARLACDLACNRTISQSPYVFRGMDIEPQTQDLNRSGERPYRSHMHPACIPCRARKSRCKTTHPSPSCFMCQINGTDCVFPQAAERQRKTPRRSRISSKGGRTSVSSYTEVSRTQDLPSVSPAPPQPTILSDTPGRGSDASTIEEAPDHGALPPQDDLITAVIDSIAKSGEGSSHVVSPAIADDDKVFQEYLSNTPYGQSGRTVRFHPNSYHSNGPARPIVFNTTPKRGSREAEGRALAASNCAIVEKLVEPYQDELINL